MSRTLAAAVPGALRRGTASWLIVLACAGLAGSWTPGLHAASEEAGPDARRKPNVVIVITDDQGYGDIAAHGNPHLRTPHLDRLHAGSARFVDFHVDPTCSPTRAALFTGRYSTRAGVWHTILGRSLLPTGEVTLAEVFAAAGYRTGLFGKWHLGDNWPLRPQDQGFHETFIHKGGGVGQAPDAWGNDYFDDVYFADGEPERVTGYCTDVWFERAGRFVERHRERPFLCVVSTNAPHGPYRVAEERWRPFAEKGLPERLARFYAMIEVIDEGIGRLRARIEEAGIARDTIFVFLTDNGSAVGWRDPGYDAGLRGGKGSEYDGGHRVPCFVRWPGGGIDAGRDVEVLSAHIDLLPTLAELCGVALPAELELDGRSLVPALRGEPGELSDRTLFVHSQRVETPVKWRRCAVMTREWRLVNGEELYAIREDRGQRQDLAGENPAVVEDLRTAYERWWRDLKPAMERTVRIGIGGEAEPVTRLCAHDAHVIEGRCPWHQGHVRSGSAGRWWWAVDVARPGRYEVELRRWPVRHGGTLEARRAAVEIAGLRREKEVEPEAEAATFTLELPAGPARFETSLELPDGTVRGAYYVRVRRLGAGG